MANQNIKVRVSSNVAATRHFYVKVAEGQGDSDSDFIYIGSTNSSGSQISTDEFSTSKLIKENTWGDICRAPAKAWDSIK